jgi:prolyl oligopeptidase
MSAETWKYPQARKGDAKDTFFGTTVADPYRWMEDDNSPERAAWVEEQNKLTFGYLDKIPSREGFKKRLQELNNVPSQTPPFRRGEYYFFYKREGLENQPRLFWQKGINGQPELLLDPNTFSKDGTVRLGTFSPSMDAAYAVYGLSKGGSDWQEYRIMDLATKKDLPEKLEWVKVSGAAWAGNGFFYSRYPAPAAGKELSTKNENHRVYFHKLNTPQADDELVYENAKYPLRFHTVATTDDQRFAILNIADRSQNKVGSAVWVRDLKREELKFKPLVAEPGDTEVDVLDNLGDKLLVMTNYQAPNFRVVLCDPSKPGLDACQTVIPEQPEPLSRAAVTGGKIFASYLKDVTTRVVVYTTDGKKESEVKLPGVGTASGFGGYQEDKFTFYTFTTMHMPATIYRYDIASRESTVFHQPKLAFNPNDFETTQVFYTSKDGTRVPMFLMAKKGLAKNGKNPTILYGYGGFSITSSPAFQTARIAWAEQGGIFAMANLRGGLEYGEKWHEAGMRFKKQNVFDDFIAAAEYLIKEKYTSTPYLAVNGGSNGGLLVGAVINQRPDLFRVAVPAVGVMDMLRYQKFTIGFNWIAEYGSAEASPEEFKNLYGYSPLHNIKAGPYPSVMITTADHDDRVVPAHSMKYAAQMQATVKSPNPVFIRVDTKSGHGASNLTKAIEASADVYAFMMHEMGLKPKF